MVIPEFFGECRNVGIVEIISLPSPRDCTFYSHRVLPRREITFSCVQSANKCQIWILSSRFAYIVYNLIVPQRMECAFFLYLF